MAEAEVDKTLKRKREDKEETQNSEKEQQESTISEPQPEETTPSKPDGYVPDPATATVEEKLAWQQYQAQQQYQFFRYVQYCQQEQEQELLRQQNEEIARTEEEKQRAADAMQYEQQRKLEGEISKEKQRLALQKAIEANPYYQQHANDGNYYDPSYQDAPKEGNCGPKKDSGDYTQMAYFNIHNGKFAAETPEQYWNKQGVPADRDGRMMSYYFDVEAYQEQMRAAAAKPGPKPKVTKAMIKTYKRKKLDKQIKRILDD